MEEYLAATEFIDCDHPDIIEFSGHKIKGAQTPKQKAIKLYYAVRDGVRYDPYSMKLERSSMKASAVLKRGYGYCVAKAVLLAACARCMNIPARLGFADVKNHLNTERLYELMQTDTFIYHGYTDLFLDGKWVKATPAFNLELCNNFNVHPLEFDGTCDSIFHPLDKTGKRHMEYVRDRGVFSDLPWDIIVEKSLKWYPRYFELLGNNAGDFSTEALSQSIK